MQYFSLLSLDIAINWVRGLLLHQVGERAYKLRTLLTALKNERWSRRPRYVDMD